jgi:uncharacterized protein
VETTYEVTSLLTKLERAHDMLLETRRRDGSWVATPVNPVVDDHRVFFRTWSSSGKAKRLRNFAEVRLAPSTVRGTPTGPTILGTATLLTGDSARHAATLLNRKFPLLQGIAVRLFHRIKHYRTLHYEIADLHA